MDAWEPRQRPGPGALGQSQAPAQVFAPLHVSSRTCPDTLEPYQPSPTVSLLPSYHSLICNDINCNRQEKSVKKPTVREKNGKIVGPNRTLELEKFSSGSSSQVFQRFAGVIPGESHPGRFPAPASSGPALLITMAAPLIL
ncbi:hypothetical protein J6590_006658 [Homalodisca vitripennis]|nr:hypothetical protein J6590_006658 [Homalodisca vitripennis]